MIWLSVKTIATTERPIVATQTRTTRRNKTTRHTRGVTLNPYVTTTYSNMVSYERDVAGHGRNTGTVETLSTVTFEKSTAVHSSTAGTIPRFESTGICCEETSSGLFHKLLQPNTK